jgi:hypothetical protein
MEIYFAIGVGVIVVNFLTCVVALQFTMTQTITQDYPVGFEQLMSYFMGEMILSMLLLYLWPLYIIIAIINSKKE